MGSLHIHTFLIIQAFLSSRTKLVTTAYLEDSPGLVVGVVVVEVARCGGFTSRALPARQRREKRVTTARGAVTVLAHT